MSQQVVDLRRSVQVARRHWLLVSVITVVGILLGCAYSVLNPPLLTSTALVVFPQSTQSTNAAAAAANGGSDAFTATLEVIATSNQVLSASLPQARPAMSLEQLRHVVSVGSVTTSIISVSAEAKLAGTTPRRPPTPSRQATSSMSTPRPARSAARRRPCSSRPPARPGRNRWKP